MAPIIWLYLKGVISASFWLWLIIVIIWSFQVQLLAQIIINRVSLLLAVRSRAKLLKWSAFIVIGLINISVFVIWIPSQLHVSQRWDDINRIWDVVEKCLFLLIDLALNCFFVYVVRTQLIANGLKKYTPLFRFNIAMIFISVSLDVILVALLRVDRSEVFIQFQCVAYITKLHIEMGMANLIKTITSEHHEVNHFASHSRQAGDFKSNSGARNAYRTDEVDQYVHTTELTAMEEGLSETRMVSRPPGMRKTSTVDVDIECGRNGRNPKR
ncbi:hypothetical protein GGR57DRAFT_473732 [Xylariaceae sp. FL1272]|nr:hypothetical protein GGR57DRAFT_473732 [Xylariaceae sp. FL1272]